MIVDCHEKALKDPTIRQRDSQGLSQPTSKARLFHRTPVRVVVAFVNRVDGVAQGIRLFKALDPIAKQLKLVNARQLVHGRPRSDRHSLAQPTHTSSLKRDGYWNHYLFGSLSGIKTLVFKHEARATGRNSLLLAIGIHQLLQRRRLANFKVHLPLVLPHH